MNLASRSSRELYLLMNNCQMMEQMSQQMWVWLSLLLAKSEVAFSCLNVFLLYLYSLSLPHSYGWLCPPLPSAGGTISPVSLWTTLFTFFVRLIQSVPQHDPAFLHQPFIISLPLPTYFPTPYPSSWPHPPQLHHHAVEQWKLPAEWASWFGQGTSQEYWLGTRGTILGGPCPD